MSLKEHLQELKPAAREQLASSCATTLGHLRNVMYGYRPCSPELAAALERHTEGAVKRCDLRPDDWRLIWPELVAAEASPGCEPEEQLQGAAQPEQSNPATKEPV